MVYLGLVDGHPPIVQLFSPVLWGVAVSPDLLFAVNDINRRIQFGRLAWTGREVMASIELPAFHITADDIGFACLYGAPRSGDWRVPRCMPVRHTDVERLVSCVISSLTVHAIMEACSHHRSPSATRTG